MSDKIRPPAEAKPVIPLLPYQRAAVACPARFTHNNWSRQTGKSFAFSLRCLMRAIEKKRTQVLLSAGARQSRELMQKVRMHAHALQTLNEYRVHDEQIGAASFKVEELDLGSGRRIIALPANPDTARGYTGDVFLDEFALHRDSREIWASLFPTVTRCKGEIDICSTPKGVSNMFAALRDNEQFVHTLLTINDAHADGLDVDVQQLHSAIGDEYIWRQEFLCEYLDEATAFLTYEQITACEDDVLPEPVRCTKDTTPAQAAIDAMLEERMDRGEIYELHVGIDIGRRHDLTVLWCAVRDGASLKTVLVCELANVPFAKQFELASQLASNAKRTAVDSTGLGMQLAEQLVDRHGTWRVDPVTFGVQTKQKLAGQLRVRIEDRSLVIPADKKIRDDFHSIERVTTTGGNVLYRSERGADGHADRFWAAALCIDAATEDALPWRGEVMGSRAVSQAKAIDAWNTDDRPRKKQKHAAMGKI